MSQQANSSNLEKMASMKENAKINDYTVLVTGATGFIGKMTHPTFNSFFRHPRVGTGFQHGNIVIGFNQ